MGLQEHRPSKRPAGALEIVPPPILPVSVPLNRIVDRVGDSFKYVYDFGDNWRHDILLKAILLPTPDVFYPRWRGMGRWKTRADPEAMRIISKRSPTRTTRNTKHAGLARPLRSGGVLNRSH
jgi:hypothetical protein